MKRYAGLRLRLLAIVLLAFTPFTVLVFLEARADHEEAMNGARNRAQYIASADAQSVGDLLGRAREALMTMSVSDAVRTHDWPTAIGYCRRLRAQSPEFLNVAIADEHGDVRASATPLSSTVNVADRAYFRGANATGGFAVGGYQVGRITGKPSIVCGYPIRDSAGRPFGVAYIALDVRVLDAALAREPLPKGAIATLFDHEGRILAHRPEQAAYVGRLLPDAKVVRAALGHDRQPETIEGLDSVQRVYAFQTAYEQGSSGLYVAAGLDESLLLAAERQGYTGRVLTLVFAAALVVALAFAAGDGLVNRPLRSLHDVVARLAAGDLDARANLPPRGDEIGDLAQECDKMAAALGRHVEAIQRNERQYRELARLLPVGVFVLDEKRAVEFANEAGLRMLGVSSLSEARTPFAERAALEDTGRLVAHLLEVGAGLRPPPIEITLVGENGHRTVVELAGAVFDDDDESSILAVAHDITERKAVDELKSDFLSMVSHELRTPLTSIMGFAQLLERPEHGDDPYQVARLSARIRERATHMTQLIEDLLRVLQAEARAFGSDKRETDVRAIVKRCIAAVDLPETHEIVLEAPRRLRHVCCDPQAVAHAVTNLLENAVKFSPEGGRVTVRISQRGDATRIEVADEGIGVPEEARETIFDRFAQADMSSTRSFGGFGLGLFIVRQVAEAHDGSVHVESGPDGGSVFTLELHSAA